MLPYASTGLKPADAEMQDDLGMLLPGSAVSEPSDDIRDVVTSTCTLGDEHPSVQTRESDSRFSRSNEMASHRQQGKVQFDAVIPLPRPPAPQLISNSSGTEEPFIAKQANRKANIGTGFYQILQALAEIHENEVAQLRTELASVHEESQKQNSRSSSSAVASTATTKTATGLTNSNYLPVKEQLLACVPGSVPFPCFEPHAIWRTNGLELEGPAFRRSISRAISHQDSDEDLIVKGGSWLQPYVLHPSCPKRLIWDCCCLIALLYDLIMVPFLLAFDPAETWFLWAMVRLVALFWSADVFVSLSTGYIRGKSLIMNPHAIWCHYAKSWLFLDLGLIALDAVYMFAASAQDGGSAARLGRSVRTLKLMRGFRLVRMLKIKRILMEVQDNINTESVSIIFSIFKTFCCLIMANHLVACGWFGIGRTAHNGWVNEYMMLERDLGFQYSTSLHWSLTQFTPASMEVFPQNTGERLYSVIALILAMICFSSFLSILTTSMSQLRQIGKEKSHQFWLLRRYMQDWGVSRHTQIRINRYLEFEYKQRKERVQDQQVMLLAMLSEPLREELKIETCCPCLEKHCFFDGIDSEARVFSHSVYTQSHAREDAIFTVGVEATSMVFVCCGLLKYTFGQSEDDEPKFELSEELSRGQWVCEPVLWTPWVHLGDLHACRESQLMLIDSAKFGAAVSRQCRFWFRTRNYAKRFIAHLNEVDKDKLTDLSQTLFSPMDILDDLGCCRTASQHSSAQSS